MTKYFKSLALSFAILSSVGVSTAKAESYPEGFFLKPYAGINLTNLNADLSTVGGVNQDDYFASKYTMANPFIGARIHENLGLELGYMQSGDKSKTNGAVSTETKVKALTLDVMGYYPLPANEKVELIGLAGVGRYKSESTITAGALSASGDGTETGIRAGLGAQYFVTDGVKVRGLAKYVHVDSDVIDKGMEFSLGVAYRF